MLCVRIWIRFINVFMLKRKPLVHIISRSCVRKLTIVDLDFAGTFTNWWRFLYEHICFSPALNELYDCLYPFICNYPYLLAMLCITTLHLNIGVKFERLDWLFTYVAIQFKPALLTWCMNESSTTWNVYCMSTCTCCYIPCEKRKYPIHQILYTNM